MITPSFECLDPSRPEAERLAHLQARKIPASLGDLRQAAAYYQPAPDLVDAVNVALAVGAPLLITGEPGTGKTQVAYYLAHHFGIQNDLYSLEVRSDTTAEDLFYRFDAVAYLYAANDPARAQQAKGTDDKLDKRRFIDPGPLWRAYKAKQPAVLLIDEIDKASRDFPNDLLNVLDQHYFHVKEIPEMAEPIRRHPEQAPIVIITSNSERRLPEPFLRRCIFHHIEFNEALVKKAVDARIKDFPHLPLEIQEEAITVFLKLRRLPLRKIPATGELLVWLAVLSAKGGISQEALQPDRPAQLPALTSLIKCQEDLDALQAARW